METNPPNIDNSAGNQIYRMVHEMDERISRPREKCLRIMNEQNSKIYDKLEDMLVLLTSLKGEMNHMFTWKEEQEKKEELAEEDKKQAVIEKKRDDKRNRNWIIGMGVSCGGWILIALGEIIKGWFRRKTGLE